MRCSVDRSPARWLQLNQRGGQLDLFALRSARFALLLSGENQERGEDWGRSIDRSIRRRFRRGIDLMPAKTTRIDPSSGVVVAASGRMSD
ncbi:hypothetical protein BRADI_2g58626v3 [Brachypodium distachyon]|uniref:Uncharacterized protein n=1 Tax=Brachypodium distachyon TaxID=15368 RepID=A0A2K2DGP5_BRADI|nr:hypothetical protein BRADI_2g58626v3 [Brachypodium distachyon]